MRWGVFVLLGVFLISFASAVIPGDCEDSMIAYWQFDNDVLDSYGDYDSGYWNGEASYVPLKVGNALDLKGSNSVIIPKIPSFYFDSSFTVEMWVNGIFRVNATFLEKQNLKFDWVFDSSSSIVVSAGDSVVEVTGLSSKTPYHIALVWDSSGEKLTLYIDGVKVDETTLSNSFGANGDLILGVGFRGLIDELAIYNTNLDDSIIGLHYNLGNAGKNYCELSGAGGESLTKTNFNINGCTFVVGDENVGVSRGTCSVGNHRGEFYCDSDLTGSITKEEGFGCAMGDADWIPGNNYCCPPGEFCNKTVNSLFKCEPRIENCFDQNDESSCKSSGCIWWYDKCISDVSDLTCGDYQNKDDCSSDSYGIAINGVNSEECNTYVECDDVEFSVLCSCSWDDSGSGECKNDRIVSSTFYSGEGVRFKCSISNVLGECINGEQTVDWNSLNVLIDKDGKPIEGDVSEKVDVSCLEELGCDSGSGTRFCGEPIVKLPGFSLFAFFMSLFIIGIYYFVRIEKEGRFK